jgi:hypothetical protein
MVLVGEIERGLNDPTSLHHPHPQIVEEGDSYSKAPEEASSVRLAPQISSSLGKEPEGTTVPEKSRAENTNVSIYVCRHLTRVTLTIDPFHAYR